MYEAKRGHREACIAYISMLQDAVLLQPTTVQAARAANIAYAMLQFRRSIQREELAPVCPQCPQYLLCTCYV